MVKRSGISRPPNMGDVAKAVGVSKTTISRYLHGQYHYMSEQTRQRIAKVIREMGYRPNKVAQSLKATNSFMIGVTLADISNPFSSQVLKGVQGECDTRGIQLLVSDSSDNPDKERANIESLLDAQVDGLIVNTVGGNDDYLRDLCDAYDHRPLVLLDRLVDKARCDSVENNNLDSALALMAHLADEQFEFVAYVTYPVACISPREFRMRALRHYVDEGRFDGQVIEYSDLEGLREQLFQVLEKHRSQRICLFINNEYSMRDVLSVLPSELRGHIGMCTFADRRWAQYVENGVTCFDQNAVDLGRKAAQMLLGRVYDGYDGPYRLVRIPTTMHVFASTTDIVPRFA